MGESMGGLEAFAPHARAFGKRHRELAARLHNAASDFNTALDDLRDQDGHAYFCYDSQMQPIRIVDRAPQAPERSADIFTYSDIFVAKGLVAAAAAYASDQLPRRAARLETIIAVIENGRLQIDEKLQGQGLEARIRLFEPAGSVIAAMVGDQQVGMMLRQRISASLGDTIWLHVDPIQAHIFDAATSERIAVSRRRFPPTSSNRCLLRLTGRFEWYRAAAARAPAANAKVKICVVCSAA